MHQIEVAGYSIDVVHKKIKNLHMAVYPPTGRLRVAAPLHIDDEAIRLHIISKLGWIKKHIKHFQQQDRLSVREYITGESHYLRGKRYLLKVIPDSSINRIKIRNNTYIDLYMKPEKTLQHRKEMITEWYRANLKCDIEPLMKKWQDIIGCR